MLLRRRIEHGLPKLEELVLLARRESPAQRMHETQLWQALGVFGGALLEELQSLVSKLKYDLVDYSDVTLADEE